MSNVGKVPIKLSLVTDAFSRKIMGYHLSDDISADNVVKAMKRVNRKRKASKELVHHCDRELKCSNAIPSMRRI